jgi:hypothetical protein
VTLTDDGSQIQNKDADIMVIGAIPDKLKDDKRIDLLVQAAQSWVNAAASDRVPWHYAG